MLDYLNVDVNKRAHFAAGKLQIAGEELGLVDWSQIIDSFDCYYTSLKATGSGFCCSTFSPPCAISKAKQAS